MCWTPLYVNKHKQQCK